MLNVCGALPRVNYTLMPGRATAFLIPKVCACMILPLLAAWFMLLLSVQCMCVCIDSTVRLLVLGTGLLVRCAGLQVRGTCLLVPRTSLLVLGTGLLVRCAGLQVRCTCLLVPRTSLLVIGTGLLVRCTGLQVRCTCLKVRRTSLLVRCTGLLVPSHGN